MGTAVWQHLPERYGKWKSVHARFTRWARKGLWEQVFAALIKDRDREPDMFVLRDNRIRITKRTTTTTAIGAGYLGPR